MAEGPGPNGGPVPRQPRGRPYLLSVDAGRAPGHGLVLARDPRVCLARLLHIAIVLLPFWLLIAVGRRRIVERFRERPWAYLGAIGSSLALLTAFVFLDMRSVNVGVVYKFRVMALLCVAPLAAAGLKRIDDRSRVASALVMGLQLMPLCYDWSMRIPGRWGTVTEPYYWQDTVLRHAVPAQDELYRWIREHTPPTAILVDNKPYIPVFSRRSLLVARQFYGGGDNWWRRHDGWLFPPTQYLIDVSGHPAEDVLRRNQLVDALYSEPPTGHGEQLIRQLDGLEPGRPIFLVARVGWQKAVLESRPRLRKVAEGGSWAIYELERDGGRASPRRPDG